MAIDVDSGVLWLGFGCYALAVGSGDAGVVVRVGGEEEARSGGRRGGEGGGD